MALMQSCCCWRTVRRGSFACALYTGIYFGLLAVTTGSVLRSEHQYMWGNHSVPQSMSILEPERMSEATIGFHVIFFACSSLGIVSCVLLLVGLYKDQRLYLLPWIINVAACSLLDVTHSFYLVVSQGLNPTTTLVYTLSFFLLCVNVYSLLCVISQYQEYLAGRGRAVDDCEYRVPAVRYAPRPTTTTATSCLSSKRPNATSNETKATSATLSMSPSQSPTAPHQRPITSSLLDKSIAPGCGTVRKHVQFPDQQTCRDNTAVTMSLTIPKEDGPSTSSSSLLMPPSNVQQVQILSTKNQTQS